ncbi:hypothetical protein NQ317_016640 [Molorchus minor]|uniref:Monocarboxylate transporter 10 n=1 Tax=Molorchus minor TaxID=1323400 RepID=A0ABQ9ITK3_9CUCU|nr:hypothetical protein NQ317_016640 [Molorchus minor]
MALVGSLAMGTTFFVSPVSGVLTDYIGIRKTTFLGGAIASSGMFLSSYYVDNIVALCITYGIMYGLGGALAYTPSLAVLGHYFKKYLGKVNGFVTAGSSAFTIVMPYIIGALLKNFACQAKKVSFGDIFNMKVIKNAKYVVWTTVIAISLFGYFVPYVYMSKFVEKEFSKDSDTKLPILCIGITSGVGRLIFGYIADLPKVNRIYLQQLSFFSIGVLTMLLPWSSGRYGWLIVIVLGMGLFDGCFISLLGPIAFDICGREGATQAIGFLLGVCSIPLTVGPYVAGVLLDSRNSYVLPFMLAGIPPTVGSVAMFAIKCVKNPKANVEESAQQPLKGEYFSDNMVLSSSGNGEKIHKVAASKSPVSTTDDHCQRQVAKTNQQTTKERNRTIDLFINNSLDYCSIQLKQLGIA